MCEEFGVDIKDIIVMMGIFIKLFGVVGGYVVGDKEVVEVVKRFLFGYIEAVFMASAVCV